MLGFSALAKSFFGSANDRKVKPLWATVAKINALEPRFVAMSDEELRAMTPAFRERLAKGETLDDLLPEAFAVVREAAKRVLGQRHFDVQLVGGMVLHSGAISEMKTGEGKTLVATLPTYLNALTGDGVHVVTVNDYLAKRDSDWMSQVYGFLGMSTGVIVHGLTDEERKVAYGADITYGTNNEFGFDYLRDNMKYAMDAMSQRGHAFAIVDEVDSILIDEARTPLIISGPTEDQTEMYRAVDSVMGMLVKDDYDLDEKQRQVSLTETGNERMAQALKAAGLLQDGDLYDIQNISIVHHVNQALKAHLLFQKDKDYIVKNGQVVIIDEFTGRMMEGRRYSEGLHQAIEAKENVTVQPENVTLASITFQNYFRLYDKLAGMTGTAMTEAAEFLDIYKLDMLEIPTNVPVQRIDHDDEVYRTETEKYEAIIKLVTDCRERGQPALVGTTSIEKSEELSTLLNKRKIQHHVLNARYHEQEAFIVADAGVSGAVTIATNMAGRGTDIQLGGNADMRIKVELAEITDEAEHNIRADAIRAEVAANKQKALAAGGLCVIGTERHESRRIDNQLRGRSGRQGDPGRSKFYLSLQDDLMRIFGSERMDSMLTKLGLKEDEAIVHPWINKALERAQKKVEARNFDIRKNLLKYDDVLNDQRKVIFEQRIELMDAESVTETIADMRTETIEAMVTRHIPERAYAEQWDGEGLQNAVLQTLNLNLPIQDWLKEEGIGEEDVLERITAAADAATAEKAERFGPEIMTYVERSIVLQTLDHLWREHIVNLDHLRSVIGFRGYAQRDPLQEYKSEAFELFQALLNNLRQMVTTQLMRAELVREAADAPPPSLPVMEGHHLDATTGEDDFGGQAVLGAAEVIVPPEQRDPQDPRTWGKIGRNEPCPCGSGKKYKHCHGAFEAV